jgi:hypothetical protein
MSKLCFNFIDGNCLHGSKCLFSHADVPVVGSMAYHNLMLSRVHDLTVQANQENIQIEILSRKLTELSNSSM